MDIFDLLIPKIKAISDILLLEDRHETYIFPADLTDEVAFTAPAAGVWNWSRIKDTSGNFLDDLFAAADGRITVIVIEKTDDNSEYYEIELGYGDERTHIASMRVYGGNVPRQSERLKSGVIPAGSEIFYRCKTTVALGSILRGHFRYHIV